MLLLAESSCQPTWKDKRGSSEANEPVLFYCGLYSQLPSEAFHMNEVEGRTFKVGQGEVKTCSQL